MKFRIFFFLTANSTLARCYMIAGSSLQGFSLNGHRGDYGSGTREPSCPTRVTLPGRLRSPACTVSRDLRWIILLLANAVLKAAHWPRKTKGEKDPCARASGPDNYSISSVSIKIFKNIFFHLSVRIVLRKKYIVTFTIRNNSLRARRYILFKKNI